MKFTEFAYTANDTKGVPKVVVKSVAKPVLKPEDAIDHILRTFIKKSRLFNVDYVKSSLAQTGNPSFQSIHVSAEDALIDGLNVSELDIEINNVVFDRKKLLTKKKIEIKNSGKTGINIKIKEDDLNEFLKKKSEKLKVKNPKIILNKDSISLSGRCKWWIIKAAFQTKGRFVIEASQNIHYIPESISLSSVDMPRYVISKVLKKINPVLSLKKFPLKVYLSKIEIRDKCLIISSSENTMGCNDDK